LQAVLPVLPGVVKSAITCRIEACFSPASQPYLEHAKFLFWEKTMKKIAMAVLASSMLAAPAMAADVKIGVLLGFTGPIESLAPNMAPPPKWR
jgi:hypothetical protein